MLSFVRNSWTLGLCFFGLLFPLIKNCRTLIQSNLILLFDETFHFNHFSIKPSCCFFTKNSLDHYILQFCGKDLALAWLVETFILQIVRGWKQMRDCARVEVDERYKVTSGWVRTCPAANNQAQVCVLQCHFSCRHPLCQIILVSGSLVQSGEHRNGNPRVVGSSPM